MKAARIHEYGSRDKIVIEEIDKPQILPSQALVEVHAASINPFDTTVREGLVKELVPGLPATLGGDLAGVVSVVGSEVKNFSVGDKVYGQASIVAGNSGAFAEFAATSADQLGKIPPSLDFYQAAGLPLVGSAAIQGIKEHMQLRPGQKILIHGGAGGIGTVAIQIAKNIGASVATTASGEGIGYVIRLGADEVIDYKTQKFEEVLSDVDAVFDTIAGETYKRSFKVLKKGGVIVSMLERPDEELMEKYGVNAIGQQTKVSTERLDELSRLVEDRVISAHVGKVYPFGQVRDAFAARESGQAVGKLVLKIKS